jgi:hypothetical protein
MLKLEKVLGRLSPVWLNAVPAVQPTGIDLAVEVIP